MNRRQPIVLNNLTFPLHTLWLSIATNLSQKLNNVDDLGILKLNLQMALKISSKIPLIQRKQKFPIRIDGSRVILYNVCYSFTLRLCI